MTTPVLMLSYLPGQRSEHRFRENIRSTMPSVVGEKVEALIAEFTGKFDKPTHIVVSTQNLPTAKIYAEKFGLKVANYQDMATNHVAIIAIEE